MRTSDWAEMVWTPEGVWLLTVPAEGGFTRSSYCGKLSLASVREFCEERGLDLHVRGVETKTPLQELQAGEVLLSSGLRVSRCA